MPEASLWAEALQNKTKLEEDNDLEVEEDDYNDRSLEAGYLTIPSSESAKEESDEEDSEDSDVKITTTSNRLKATPARYFDIPRFPHVGPLDKDQENEIRKEINQELRAFRSYSSSSDEEPYIIIGGRRISVPRSRAHQAR